MEEFLVLVCMIQCAVAPAKAIKRREDRCWKRLVEIAEANRHHKRPSNYWNAHNGETPYGLFYPDLSTVQKQEVEKQWILANLICGTTRKAESKDSNTEHEKFFDLVDYEEVSVDRILRMRNNPMHIFEDLKKEIKQNYIGIFRRKKKYRSCAAPEWVVAVRGTIPTNLQDVYNGVRTALETLHNSSLSRVLEVVISTLGETYGWGNVCVTGYSLGAVAGLLVCQHIVSELHKCSPGVQSLDCHFFNPPSTSLIEQVFYVTNHLKKFATKFLPSLPKIFNKPSNTDSEVLREFGSWAPHLYLNPKDPMCNDYLNIFEMTEQGKPPFEQGSPQKYGTPSPSTLKWLISCCLGETRPFHRFPNAIVHEFNTRVHWWPSFKNNFCVAHWLYQWMDISNPPKPSRRATNERAYACRTVNPYGLQLVPCGWFMQKTIPFFSGLDLRQIDGCESTNAESLHVLCYT